MPQSQQNIDRIAAMSKSEKEQEATWMIEDMVYLLNCEGTDDNTDRMIEIREELFELFDKEMIAEIIWQWLNACEEEDENTVQSLRAIQRDLLEFHGDLIDFSED